MFRNSSLHVFAWKNEDNQIIKSICNVIYRRVNRGAKKEDICKYIDHLKNETHRDNVYLVAKLKELKRLV